MLALADEGDRDRDDDSCGIMFGILRDSGYRLRRLAEEECENMQTDCGDCSKPGYQDFMISDFDLKY